MSRPLERHPGTVYLVTRRCERREFRLRPGAGMNGAIGVVVADACVRTGVEVIAHVWMSNHYHAVVHDPDGRVSEWMAQVHGMLARYCNGVQGGRSHVWDAQGMKDVVLEGAEIIASKVAYVLANPVAAGLVYEPRAWPGVMTRWGDLGRGRGEVFRRPAGFFRADGPVSEWAEVVSVAPPGVEVEEFREMVRGRLEVLLAEARERVAASGRGYLGASGVLRQEVFGSAASEESSGGRSEPFRRIVAGERTAELVARQRYFEQAYARALCELQLGRREVMFPAGTYKVWRFFGARREPPLSVRAA